MMNRSRAILTMCACVLAFLIPALAQGQGPEKEPPKDVDVTGTWALTVTRANGGESSPNDAIFTQDKDALQFAMPGGPGGAFLTGTGTVKGNVLEWKVTISGPQGEMTIVFKGKVEGDSMSGDVSMGDFGTFTWSATKKTVKSTDVDGDACDVQSLAKRLLADPR
jgi:hypothetical protein